MPNSPEQQSLPTFVIVGAAKSGTTALYHWFNQHPEVYMSPVKEPHFFQASSPPIRVQGMSSSTNPL